MADHGDIQAKRFIFELSIHKLSLTVLSTKSIDLLWIAGTHRSQTCESIELTPLAHSHRVKQKLVIHHAFPNGVITPFETYLRVIESQRYVKPTVLAECVIVLSDLLKRNITQPMTVPLTSKMYPNASITFSVNVTAFIITGSDLASISSGLSTISEKPGDYPDNQWDLNASVSRTCLLNEMSSDDIYKTINKMATKLAHVESEIQAKAMKLNKINRQNLDEINGIKSRLESEISKKDKQIQILVTQLDEMHTALAISHQRELELGGCHTCVSAPQNTVSIFNQPSNDGEYLSVQRDVETFEIPDNRYDLASPISATKTAITKTDPNGCCLKAQETIEIDYRPFSNAETIGNLINHGSTGYISTPTMKHVRQPQRLHPARAERQGSFVTTTSKYRGTGYQIPPYNTNRTITKTTTSNIYGAVPSSRTFAGGKIGRTTLVDSRYESHKQQLLAGSRNIPSTTIPSMDQASLNQRQHGNTHRIIKKADNRDPGHNPANLRNVRENSRIGRETGGMHDIQLVSHGAVPMLALQRTKSLNHNANNNELIQRAKSLESNIRKENNYLRTPSMQRRHRLGENMEAKVAVLERDLISTKLALANSETQWEQNVASIKKKSGKK